ncbi:MAG: hypothetical protein L0H23_06010 [Luteimonas sp.]|nr:hypothetical protein [Luteimonas sp.]
MDHGPRAFVGEAMSISCEKTGQTIKPERACLRDCTMVSIQVFPADRLTPSLRRKPTPKYDGRVSVQWRILVGRRPPEEGRYGE